MKKLQCTQLHSLVLAEAHQEDGGVSRNDPSLAMTRQSGSHFCRRARGLGVGTGSGGNGTPSNEARSLTLNGPDIALVRSRKAELHQDRERSARKMGAPRIRPAVESCCSRALSGSAKQLQIASDNRSRVSCRAAGGRDLLASD